LIRRLLIALAISATAAAAQDAAVRVTGSVVATNGKGKRSAATNAVVWLTPQDPAEGSAPIRPGNFTLLQKNKRFHPHLLVVPVNSTVEFPNADHFFHNVFSVYEGTRFDLGLYESGSSKKVRFSRPGASYIFCNIHPEMSAIVMVMKSPYYAVTGADGQYSIQGVPDGEYTLHVWYERAKPEDLQELLRRVTVSSGVPLPTLLITEAASLSEGHKNKYGQDYEQSAPSPY